MEEDIDFNREIIVNVHKVDSFNSNESNQIFIATNNIKNVQMSDNPQVKFQNICNRLKDRFPKGISNNPKRGKGTGHRLDKKELYNLMMYNDYFNNSEHSEDQLFEEIVQLNSKESLKSFDEAFEMSIVFPSKLNSIVPVSIFPSRMHIPKVDFPHPDSPTNPKVSPLYNSKFKLSTAFNKPILFFKNQRGWPALPWGSVPFATSRCSRNKHTRSSPGLVSRHPLSPTCNVGVGPG